jgi:ferrous iron transport protein B
MSLIGLVGLPNSGKSALFNSLTNSRQKVANFPGITVEKKYGTRVIDNDEVQIVDLPGLYTLDASSMDERVTRDYILSHNSDTQADAFVLVVDSTNFSKSLYLALQMIELNVPVVVALNMFDLATKRGQKIDIEKLSNLLEGAKVIPTIATKAEGIKDLDLVIKELLNNNNKTIKTEGDYLQKIKNADYIKSILDKVDSIVKEVVVKTINKDTLTDKLDSIVLHPVLGPFVLMAVLVFLFQLLFVWADPFVGLIETGFELLSNLIDTSLSDGYLKSLLIDGVIAGVGGIVVFLPHIIFLFILINALEDFGYLGRAAFLLDFLMRKVGLPGKAVIPLLSSHACAIPGIMGARIIENPRQRLLTIMLSPLMACSARLPVYTLLIAAIVPNEKVFGFIGMPGLVMFALYAFAILTSFVIAFVTKATAITPTVSTLMMELPAYRVPKLKNVLLSAFQKGYLFLKKAGTIIFVLSIIIWGLVTFPEPPKNATGPAINYSAAAKIGKTIQPIFAPLGFDWKMTTALIPSFAAREVLVSAMGTVMNVHAEDDDKLIDSLSSRMGAEYSMASLLALLVWFVFSPQCIATIAVMKKETNGYKMPMIFLAYTLVLAYVASLITYMIFSL